MAVTKINHYERVSTGAVRFASDWPGLFIRGDEALGLASQIGAAQREDILPCKGPGAMFLQSVIDLLESCRVLEPEILAQPIDFSECPSGRIRAALESEGAKCWRDLVGVSEAELLRTPNFGRRSLKLYKEWLAKYGLELDMTVNG